MRKIQLTGLETLIELDALAADVRTFGVDASFERERVEAQVEEVMLAIGVRESGTLKTARAAVDLRVYEVEPTEGDTGRPRYSIECHFPWNGPLESLDLLFGLITAVERRAPGARFLDDETHTERRLPIGRDELRAILAGAAPVRGEGEHVDDDAMFCLAPLLIARVDGGFSERHTVALAEALGWSPDRVAQSCRRATEILDKRGEPAAYGLLARWRGDDRAAESYAACFRFAQATGPFIVRRARVLSRMREVTDLSDAEASRLVDTKG